MPVQAPTPKVSSFRVIKGSMIPETYAAFRAWDLTQSKQANLLRLKAENTVQAATANWLRDVIFTISARFEPSGRDRPLVLLAQQDPGLEAWRPLLLWQLAQGELLISHFLKQWLFPRIQDGQERFAAKDVIPYLEGLSGPGGPVEQPWTPSTIKHVAAALLKLVADFNLLVGGPVKALAPFHLSERGFLYVLYDLVERLKNPRMVVEAEDWRIFLLSPAAVHQELLRLHQYRRLEYHTAGSIVELKLPCPNLLAYVEGWTA